MDLAETDENGNENERGNENEKGNGRQEGCKCGIGRRSCKLMLDSEVHPETYHRLKTGCSFELYNYILGQHTQKICLSGVWQDLSGPSLHLAIGS